MLVHFIDSPGNLSWLESALHCKKLGGRLPTKKEISQSIKLNGSGPLFTDDMWIPVADSYNCWISVGTFDVACRLGKTHAKSCGIKPEWGDSSDFFQFRTKLGLVMSRVQYVPTHGCFGYSGAVAYAKSLGARLATKAEVRATLIENCGKPLFNADVWVPVGDKANNWVSVGNFDPLMRLGRTHAKLWDVPVWNEDTCHWYFRSHIALVFEKNTPLVNINIVAAPASHGWDALSQFAAAQGCRLATTAEIQHYIHQHKGGKPLFDSDVWLPTSDAPNCWISAGNYEPKIRLGKTHEELFCVYPSWSNDCSSDFSFRGQVALVPIGISYVKHAKGNLSWSNASVFARSLGGRLPTHAEVNNALKANGMTALFPMDAWFPVKNGINQWVSVGDFDVTKRLGCTHEELFGAPTWGEDEDAAHDFRKVVGVVFD